jgi:hypothetical protein
LLSLSSFKLTYDGAVYVFFIFNAVTGGLVVTDFPECFQGNRGLFYALCKHAYPAFCSNILHCREQVLFAECHYIICGWFLPVKQNEGA